jgi:hypothetical protein
MMLRRNVLEYKKRNRKEGCYGVKGRESATKLEFKSIK